MKSRFLVILSIIALLAPSNAARADSQPSDVMQVHMDDQSRAVLTAVDKKLASASSVSAVVETSTEAGPASGIYRSMSLIEIQRPNFARVASYAASYSAGTWTKGDETDLQVLDGSNAWDYWDMQKNYYSKDPATPYGTIMGFIAQEPLDNFLDPSELQTALMEDGYPSVTVTYIGQERWNGVPYREIALRSTMKMTGHETLKRDTTLFVGSDHVIHRILKRFTVGGTSETQDMAITNIEFGAKIASTDFTFSPPVGGVEKNRFANDGFGSSEKSEPALLANGTQAPDFTVDDAAGNPVKLSDYQGKVVVIDFWATWCGPCQESLPHTNAVARKFAGKNVVFLAINVWDTKDAFTQWLPQHKSYSSLHFAIDTSPSGQDVATNLYKVSGIPTQYVIDPSGKIVKTFVGYDGPSTDLTDAVAAASAPAPASASQASPTQKSIRLPHTQ